MKNINRANYVFRFLDKSSRGGGGFSNLGFFFYFSHLNMLLEPTCKGGPDNDQIFFFMVDKLANSSDW